MNSDETELTMKACSACKGIKSVSAFTRDRSTKSGYTSACSACRVEMSKRWRHSNPDKALAQSQRRPARGKGNGQRRWRAENIGRDRIVARAGMAVHRALMEGRLIRPVNCEECGSGIRFIEAAHFNYSEPLRVRWLCRPCHRAWDKAEPKSLEVAHV